MISFKRKPVAKLQPFAKLRPQASLNAYLLAASALARVRAEQAATSAKLTALDRQIAAARAADHRSAQELVMAMAMGREIESYPELAALKADRLTTAKRSRALEDAYHTAVDDLTDAAVDLRAEFAAQLRGEPADAVREQADALLSVFRPGWHPFPSPEELLPLLVAAIPAGRSLGALSDPLSVLSQVIGACVEAGHLEFKTPGGRHRLSGWEPGETWSRFKDFLATRNTAADKLARAARRKKRQEEETHTAWL